MVLESLKFNDKGHSKHMENGIEYDDETLTIELIDNSDQSIQSKLKNSDKDRINIIKGDDFFYIEDTGKGVSNNDLYNKVLRYYEINPDKEIGMSKSGIGLKYALNNLMRDNNIAYILSKTDNGDEYAVAVLIKVSGEIKIDDCMKGSTKRSVMENIDEVINNDGFMILIIRKVVYLDKMDIEDYMKLLKEYISYTRDISKHKSYDELNDKIQLLFRDDIRNYSILLNNEEINYIDYINPDSDELMFSLNLIIKQKGNNHHDLVYVDDTNIYYRYAKRDFEIKEGTHTDQTIDGQPLARISFYKCKNDKPDDMMPNGSFINYRMIGERNICRCPLSKSKGYDKRTMNYLKIDCEIINREYCREKILKSVKASTNSNCLDPTDNLKRLNIVITKICVNKDILNIFGWTLEKWLKEEQRLSETGNLFHIKKERAIQLKAECNENDKVDNNGDGNDNNLEDNNVDENNNNLEDNNGDEDDIEDNNSEDNNNDNSINLVYIMQDPSYKYSDHLIVKMIDSKMLNININLVN